MTEASSILATVGVLLGAIGTYLLLPQGRGEAKARASYVAGGLFAALGLLGLLALLTPPAYSPLDELAEFVAGSFFYVFAAGALGCAVMTVTSQSPVYSALWFAGVAISTAGLFLLAGAQFLAAGNTIVYAGAIVVTFLFVIMLAQMEGKAAYDRASRSPGRAVFTSFLLLWSLAYCLAALPGSHRPGVSGAGTSAEDRLRRGRDLGADFFPNSPQAGPRLAMEKALRPSSSLYVDGDPAQAKPNVAGLGEALFTDHLLTVELAGSILFVALIAAVLIADPKPIGGAGKAA
jgi:NADH-quinone oxidoreductase subunit J